MILWVIPENVQCLLNILDKRNIQKSQFIFFESDMIPNPDKINVYTQLYQSHL